MSADPPSDADAPGVFRDIDTHSYGFSVSDGLLDKGVYIHSIKPDGPANRAGIQPYDKILQINNTRFSFCEMDASGWSNIPNGKLSKRGISFHLGM